jgi:formate-dependent nitrite reductase cytochrome c552 subunit
MLPTNFPFALGPLGLPLGPMQSTGDFTGTWLERLLRQRQSIHELCAALEDFLADKKGEGEPRLEAGQRANRLSRALEVYLARDIDAEIVLAEHYEQQRLHPPRATAEMLVAAVAERNTAKEKLAAIRKMFEGLPEELREAAEQLVLGDMDKLVTVLEERVTAIQADLERPQEPEELAGESGGESGGSDE